MRPLRLCALALVAELAHGYLDTSPFFMFSTSELLTSTAQLQHASSLVADVALALSDCPSEYYILVQQPGVDRRDYGATSSTPVLADAVSKERGRRKRSIRSSTTVSDVEGRIDETSWVDILETQCQVQTMAIDGSKGSIPSKFPHAPTLIKVNLPPPSPSVSRAKDLGSNDAFFASILDLLPTQNYTVLYTTSRACRRQTASFEGERTEYDMRSPIQDAMHLDLKRDLTSHLARATNQTLVDGPLFDKYQFFTPGIFMGLLVVFLLSTILYVGVSALASLQVTYAAFDKETGALAGKKQ